MAEKVYSYLRSATLFGTVAVGKMAAEITMHPWITVQLVSVALTDPDGIAITFEAELNELEKGRLDGIVAGHAGVDLKFKRLASRGVVGLEVSLKAGQQFDPLDGFVIDPLELTGTVARLKIRLCGEWKAAGAGAQLQVIETADGNNENKYAAGIPVADTSAAWEFFTVDSDVALRVPGSSPNRYRLDGKRAGAQSAAVRYCELSLIWV